MKQFLKKLSLAATVALSTMGAGCQYFERKCLDDPYSTDTNWLEDQLGMTTASLRATAPDGIGPNFERFVSSFETGLDAWASFQVIDGVKKWTVYPLLYFTNGLVTEVLGIFPDIKSTEEVYGERRTLLFRKGVENPVAQAISYTGDPIKGTWRMAVSGLLSDEGIIPHSLRYGLALGMDAIRHTDYNEKKAKDIEERLLSTDTKAVDAGKVVLGSLPILENYFNRERYKIETAELMPDYVPASSPLNPAYTNKNTSLLSHKRGYVKIDGTEYRLYPMKTDVTRTGDWLMKGGVIAGLIYLGCGDNGSSGSGTGGITGGEEGGPGGQ